MILPKTSFAEVRAKLLARDEIALIDVREEAPHAEGHPLFAANMPYSRLELLAHAKLPRRDVPIVTIDSGEGLAEASAERLVGMGYRDVSVFDGGIAAWKAAGGYGRQGQGRGAENATKERLWFSPHCLSARQGSLL